MQEIQVQSLGQEDPLEKRMSTHSSTLAWRIPWTEKPGGLQSTGLQVRDISKYTHTIMTFPKRHLDIWLFILWFYSFIHNYICVCVCVFVYIYTYIYIIKSECTLFTFSQDAFDYSKPVFLQKFFKNWQMKQHHTSL